MGKPLPVELGERIVTFVEEGHSHRSAAARFRVFVKFVNDMVILKRETGGLEPRAQDNGAGTESWAVCEAGCTREWIPNPI